MRREKANRNLPLIARNRERFPTRVLNDVIELREAVLRANDLVAQKGLGHDAQQLYGRAITLFETKFSDPGHKYHQIARPFYEQAVQHLADCWEFEVAFAGKHGKLNGQHARPRRFKARRPEDVEAILAAEAKKVAEAMLPVTLHTDPFEEHRR